jgi:uncharacterized protein YoxC
LSEQNESRFGIGNGIVITTGFDVSAQLPLDSRTVVQTTADLANIPEDYRYEGLLVFVIDGEEDGNKLYQWKRNLDADGNLSTEYSWGPIEAEVSAKELFDLLEIDFENTPSLMMQKNKKDFFPIVHDSAVLAHVSSINEETGEVTIELTTMDNKYQTIVDEDLETTDKTIVGSVNEINTKMEDSIDEFRKEISSTLQKLKDDVAQMQKETEEIMDQLKADIIADMAALKKETEETFAAMQEDLEKTIQDTIAQMNAMIAQMQKDMADKMAFMDSEFERMMAEINDEIAALRESITSQVDQMLQDVDNVILSDDQVNDFMRQIRENLDALADI